MNENSLPVVFVVVISIGDTSVVSIVIIDASDAASVVVDASDVTMFFFFVIIIVVGIVMPNIITIATIIIQMNFLL